MTEHDPIDLLDDVIEASLCSDGCAHCGRAVQTALRKAIPIVLEVGRLQGRGAAIADLRDTAAVMSWANKLSAYAGYGLANWSCAFADYLEAQTKTVEGSDAAVTDSCV